MIFITNRPPKESTTDVCRCHIINDCLRICSHCMDGEQITDEITSLTNPIAMAIKAGCSEWAIGWDQEFEDTPKKKRTTFNHSHFSRKKPGNRR